MQNVVGPTVVAMATKFGLGVEIQSPTGLFNYFKSFHLICYLARNLMVYIVHIDVKTKDLACLGLIHTGT